MIKPISIANLTDPIAGLPADCVDRTVRSVISKFFILAGQLAVIDQDDVIIRIDLFNLIQLTDSDPLNGVVEMMLQLSRVAFASQAPYLLVTEYSAASVPYWLPTLPPCTRSEKPFLCLRF